MQKKSKRILAVSLVALMAAGTAYAEMKDERTTNAPVNSTRADYDKIPAPNDGVQQNDSKAMKSVKRGLNKASAAMRKTGDKIEAFFVDQKKNALAAVSIPPDTTADGMIGKDIASQSGEKIAEVEDLLIDRNGSVTKVIVADGGLLGIGEKLAAFDYNRVVHEDEDGNLVMNLTQESIDQAAEFSYERGDSGKADVIPEGSLSAKELLDGTVYNSDGQQVAVIDNVSISGGTADRLLVKFDRTAGLGGKLAALDYSTLDVKKVNGNIRVNLSPAQSRQFKDFSKMAHSG